MYRRKNKEYSEILLYLILGVVSLLLRYVGANFEPFSLALFYAAGSVGLNPWWCGAVYLVPSLIRVEWVDGLIALFQTLILSGAFAWQNHLNKAAPKRRYVLPLFGLSCSLAAFVAVSPFVPYALPLLALYQKVAVAGCIFLLSAVFSVALKALLRKFLRCRLYGEEIVFCALGFALVGIGFCRFFGFNAYMGVALFVLLLFSCAVKDASAIVCAFVLSLPSYLLANVSIDRFFLYGVAVTLFIKSGRLAAALSVLAVFFAYGYFEGLYLYPTDKLVQSLLSAVLPALFFVLVPTPLVRALENKFTFYKEKHLSRIAINRNRAAIGEQLYEISAVFREIQSTFTALSTTEAEEGAREYICGSVVAEACRGCPQYAVCQRKGTFTELNKLIEIGCMKGRVSLVDVPARLGETCVNQNLILTAVNGQLVDYRKYMAETENAASGRALLAGQAQGVSEILKNLALEQSEPLKIYTEKERALNVALLSVGIVCSEVLIYGEEDNLTLSLVTFGAADVKKVAAVASDKLGTEMMISKRITLSRDKFCCILRKKPIYDAAFGVASTHKAGENASGDTHAVIKIDERRFLVALCDGMGSGEYARRISESTISLLESFYRAKMPSEVVLSTINKLITFSKEETFACVDVAVVDLDEGKADVVKIGSPAGFILSGNTVKVLESSSLPLGILDSLHPDAARYDFGENDTLLFLSDGITGAFGSTADLYEVLKTIPTGNPKQLADTLLERALNAYGGVARDDMTALAVRLFKAIS